MESNSPELIIEGGPREDEVIQLGPTVTFGREESNDIVVDDGSASRTHAEIIQTDEGYALRDLRSTNGTFVNQEKLGGEDYLLKDGDRIRLGPSEMSFIFRYAPADVAAPAPAEAPPDEAQPAEPVMLQPPVEEAEEVPAEQAVEEMTPAAEAMPVAAELTDEAEAPPPAPSKVPFAGLILAIQQRLRRRPKVADEAEAFQPAEEEIPHEPLPLLTRVARAFHILIEQIDLLRRRRLLTLSVEHEVVRAVVFEGTEVVAWGIADPNEGDPFEDESTGQQAQLPSRTRALLTELRGRRARLVTDLPLYTPLIRNLPVPEKTGRYLDGVVATEITGSIPFSQAEVDIKWQAPKGSGEQRVAAIAVQKRAIDAHVYRMKTSGMGPAATYSQASALALSAGVLDAMVIHLGPAQSAVVLVRDGIAQAVHQVPTADRDQNVQEQAEGMARAVEQMEGYDQTLASREGSEFLPVIFTGQLPGGGQLENEVRQILHKEVLPLSPNVKHPDEFPIAEFATNVGLALLARGRIRTWRGASGPEVVSLDLLSERHIPTPLPMAQVALFLILALFAVTAFNLTPRVTAVSADAKEKADELVSMKKRARDHRISLGNAALLQREARDIRRQTLLMKSRVEDLTEEIETFKVSFDRIEEIIQKTRPDNVEVSNFTPKEDAFVLSATAPTLDAAIKYANNIRASPLFTNFDVDVRQVGSGGARSPGESTGLESLLGGDGPPTANVEAIGSPLTFLIEAEARPPGEEPESAQ